jgi:tetratricopeptide (TPR) repeat protein
MRSRAVLSLLAAVVAWSWTARAADAPASTLSPAQSTPAPPDHPWIKDGQLIRGVVDEVGKNGIMAVQPHAADLEVALAGARHSFEVAAAGDGDTTYALTDGPTDTLMALMGGTMNKDKKRTVAEPNPYPPICFYLASYYDEVGKPEDALRVLDLGLSLPGADLNAHRGDLLIERGAALASLKRWEDSLGSYYEAIKINDAAPSVRAYMYRGRGFALT